MSMYDANATDDNDDGTDDDAQNQTGKVNIDRSHLRALEKKAQKGADADRLQRENLMLKLGVDTDSVGGKLLLDNPNLPLDKPDEIKAMAIAVGAIRQTTPPPGEATGETQGTDQGGEQTPVGGTTEANGSDERSALGQGAVGDTGRPTEDPRKIAATEAVTAMERGATEEDALGHYFNSLANAAATGDQRVRVG